MEELWETHSHQIRRSAEKFHARFSWVPYSDLYEVGITAFLHAYDTYDEARGTSFSSWLYRVLHSRMQDHIRWRKRKNEVLLGDTVPVIAVDPFKRRMRWLQIWDSFSADARLVCHLVFRKQGDLGIDCNKPSEARSIIAGELLSRGWSRACVFSAFREIKGKV